MQAGKKILRSIIIYVVIFYCLLALIAGFFIKKAVSDTSNVLASTKQQDLETIKKQAQTAKGSFQRANFVLTPFIPLRIIPLLGWYVADIQRGVSAASSGMSAVVSLAEAITPYADVLGFKGQGSFLGGTAQERLSQAVETLAKVSPQLDVISKDLNKSRKQIDAIQPWRYPNFLPGQPGAKIKSIKQSLDQVDDFISQARPLIEVLPEILGENKDKKYLVLFQNDAELRPTGGFITAYAFFKVKKGQVESEGSSDIYQLDNSLTKKFPAPEPIVKYLPNVDNLNIRDSNLSPDFLASMKQFEELYSQTTADKNIDGIIALNTKFVLKMIEALGPIEAQGTKFTTEIVEACDCPQIIYELEKDADQPVNFEKAQRKGLLGTLMQQMMDTTFSAPKSKWPDIISVFLSSLKQKDILVYLKDAKSQEALDKVNFAGRLYKYDGDYLHVNETNFAGAKSNLYVQEKVKHNIKKEKDKLNEKLTIEYKYPRQQDNCSLERKGGLCLAGIYRDWIRIYVPKGSTLIKSSGIEQNLTQSEDLQKTVFEGFLTLKPEGIAKLEVEYTVPIKAEGKYKLLIQKQPGTPNHSYEIEAFGKKLKDFSLDTDKELTISL